jgi:hypothetical protein
MKPAKPLGRPAYGSIPHLPGSRVGPGDWHLHEGQARILLEKCRPGDHIVVEEKLDGACMSVANIDGEIVPLIRAGYRARDGLFEHLRAFEPWVAQRADLFATLLAPGERIVGEWLALAHGTLYDPAHPSFRPFVAFDIFRNNERVLRDEFWDRTRIVTSRARGLAHAPVLHEGGALGVAEALACLGATGYRGALEPPEGAVWRCEREGRVEFLAKYVRPEKIDGRYLPEISGGEAIWHIERPAP